MIARKHRFHGHGSLNYVYRKGQSARQGYLSLRFVHARQPDYRLAVVVSKKVSKSAVVRNRIRRRVYEAVRLRKAANPQALWPVDMVIGVFDEKAATSDNLFEQVDKLIARATSQ